jgi:hypothetical protein
VPAFVFPATCAWADQSRRFNINMEINMPDFSECFGGRFMKAEHITKPFIGVIESVELVDVDGNGKMKPVLHFEGKDRGVVLNATRHEFMCHYAETKESDDWVGLKVAVRKGTTRFGGKVTDCIEFGMPPKTPAQQKAETELNDAIPF